MDPKVSFYILQDMALEARATFACRLAEKAWHNAVNTHIHTASKSDASALHALLWSYRDESFLPHALVNPDQKQSDRQYDEPVTVGYDEDQLEGCKGLLINLGDTIPGKLAGFSRIAEVVVQDTDSLALARTRFRQYRDKGMSPKHQKVG